MTTPKLLSVLFSVFIIFIPIIISVVYYFIWAPSHLFHGNADIGYLFEDTISRFILPFAVSVIEIKFILKFINKKIIIADKFKNIKYALKIGGTFSVILLVITFISSGLDEYKEKLAYLNKNPIFCHAIFSETYYREECLIKVAELSGRDSFCEGLISSQFGSYKECYNAAAITREGLNSVNNTGDEYIISAFRESDYSICNSVVGSFAKDFCFNVVALKKDDIGGCNRIVNPANRARCMYEFTNEIIDNLMPTAAPVIIQEVNHSPVYPKVGETLNFSIKLKNISDEKQNKVIKLGEIFSQGDWRNAPSLSFSIDSGQEKIIETKIKNYQFGNSYIFGYRKFIYEHKLFRYQLGIHYFLVELAQGENWSPEYLFLKTIEINE